MARWISFYGFSKTSATSSSSHSLKQAEIVDSIEDLVLKDRFLQESEELGGVRRLLTRLRRQVDAQRHALAQLNPPPATVAAR